MSRKPQFHILGSCLFLCVIFILGFPLPARGLSLTLAWDPPATGQVDSYLVFYRLPGQGYNYSQPIWEGPSTTCTLSNLQDATAHFVVRAHNAYGESLDSNEATYYSFASDTDGDGIPDGWEVFYGLSPWWGDDASQDFDGDGFSNLREYRTGTDPNNPSSYPFAMPWIPLLLLDE